MPMEGWYTLIAVIWLLYEAEKEVIVRTANSRGMGNMKQSWRTGVYLMQDVW